MNIKFRNLLLVGSIVALTMLTGCADEEEDNTPPPSNNSANETGTFTDSRDSKVYKYVTIGE